MSERNAPSRVVSVAGGIIAAAGLAVALMLYARAFTRVDWASPWRQRSRLHLSHTTRCRFAACACVEPDFRPKQSSSICRSWRRSSRLAARWDLPRARLHLPLGSAARRSCATPHRLPIFHGTAPCASLLRSHFCPRHRRRATADTGLCRCRVRRRTLHLWRLRAGLGVYVSHRVDAVVDAACARSAHVGRNRRRRHLGNRGAQ